VSASDCPRPGKCDQGITANYLGMPIKSAFCASRSEGDTCQPLCESHMCIPRPNFGAHDKYAKLCATLRRETCGVPGAEGGDTWFSHRCIWAGEFELAGPTFTCTESVWALTDPGKCKIGDDGKVGLDVGPTCEALKSSQCLQHATACPSNVSSTCAGAVMNIATECKFPCISIMSGGAENLDTCAHCIYESFGVTSIEDFILHVEGDNGNAAAEPYGPPGRLGHNATAIQQCCGCLPTLFQKIMGMGPAKLEEVLLQPCLPHSPLEDDDLNMDDDEIRQGGWSSVLLATAGSVPAQVLDYLRQTWTLLSNAVEAVEL
jgi:hypothetical protein